RGAAGLKSRVVPYRFLAGLTLRLMLLVPLVALAALPQTIEQIKPSLVGIGTFQKTRSPAVIFFGTGFVVGDGRHVVTNAHTVEKPLDLEKRESFIVLVAGNGEPQPRDAQLLATDKEH